MTDFPLLVLIPLAPLLGAAYNGLAGCRMQSRFGRRAVHIPAILMPAISFAITALAFFKLLALPHEQRALHCRLWEWMPVGGIDAAFAFIMDPLTLVMCGVVTFVGTLIHVYSVGYMREEPSYWRFFSYLNLFMFAMLTLVLGDNFLVMFVGWEGVGLCSYLLIGFWYKEHKNAAAGMKAFVVNRIGDFGFILGVMLLFWGLQGGWRAGVFEKESPAHAAAMAPAHGEHVEAGAEAVAPAGGESPERLGGVTFRHIKEQLAQPAAREALAGRTICGVSLISLIGALFFLGAMGKSAQIPLYVWLPDAMAGPTPVSALIHAATMVTAGVYMVARLDFIFALSPFLMTWVTFFGVLTAVFAATIGLFQHDIKRVLAYSTVSQLGFMFVGVGVGAYWVGIFHLMTHAFFKACLFLASGSVILGCHHEQDMRRMGGLKEFMPITARTYFAACCAIAGFPLTAGFFSKDEILWKAFDAGNLILPGGGALVWALGALGALGTSFYMFRSYYMTFSGKYRGAPAVGHGGAHAGHAGHNGLPAESPASMTGVLIVLAVLSLAGGFIGLPHLWHLPNYLHLWLDPVFEESAHLVVSAGHGPSAEWTLMAVSVGLALAGWSLARLLYLDGKNPLPARLFESPNRVVRGAHALVYNKYYVDEIYAAVFVRGVMALRQWCDRFDRVVVDGLVGLTAPLVRALGRLHGRTDVRVVDGAVNGAAWAVGWSGDALRLLQTGRLKTYLGAVMFGSIVLIVLNYLFLP